MELLKLFFSAIGISLAALAIAAGTLFLFFKPRR
jgi:hypothetical protein